MNVYPVNQLSSVLLPEIEREEVAINIAMPLQEQAAAPLNHRVSLSNAILNRLKIELILWRLDPSISATKRANREIAAQKILDCLLNQKSVLNLEGLQLDSLPDLLWECTSLECLILNNNRLVNLSPRISQLTRLISLSLFDNLLIEIPAEIGQLSHLTELHLEGNKLTLFPTEIINLSDLCEIFVDGNPIPIEILNQFISLSDSLAILNGNQGPHIILLKLTFKEKLNAWIAKYHQLFPEKDPSLPDALYVEQSAAQNPFYQPLITLEARDKETFSNFLEKVEETSDFKTSPASTALIVIRLLTGVVQKEAFRTKALEYMEEALGACEDRISLRLGDIDVLWQLHFLYNPRDTKGLLSLLLGAHRMKLLDNLVLEKVEQEKIYDAVEVLLYNRMRLKDALELPLQQVSMIYEADEWTRTTQEELDTRRNLILSQTSRAEDVARLLIESDLWQEKLEREMPREFSKIQERSGRNLEKLEEKKERLTSQEFADANTDALLLYEQNIRRLRYNATFSIVKRLGFEHEKQRHKRKEFA